MSLNFSIDSILRHGNVESSNSTLIGSNKLNQANFLKKQLNHQQLNTYLQSSNSSSSTAHPVTTNGLNSANQLNDATSNTPSQLQSPLFYLNKAAANPTSVINLMDSVQSNGSTANSLNSSAFAFELNQLNQLSHLSPLELCRLNQLAGFPSQLVSLPYLSKINSSYNDESLNSNGRSNQFDNHSHHTTNSNHHHKLTLQNNASSKAAFLTLATNGGSTLFGSNSGFSGIESQCSPLSDKSSEVLLNYEDRSDSSDSGRHSGNNISINSNNSNPNDRPPDRNFADKCNRQGGKDTFPLCTKCKLHGIHNLVKGHKKKCPKKDCTCELCILTDYGKRLRGKKIKKASVAANLLSNTAAAAAAAKPATNLSNLMMDTLSEANNSMNNYLHNHFNENGELLNASTVVNLSHHHQSTTPNSNSNSSCSNMSISNPLAVSLRNHPTPSSLQSVQQSVQQSSTSSSICNNLALNQQLTNLHSGIGFMEKNALKDYMKLVVTLLKKKLAQDGLIYEQELNKLKFAVIYLLLTRFDKNELLTKLMTDA